MADSLNEEKKAPVRVSASRESRHRGILWLPPLDQKRGETEIPRRARFVGRPPLTDLFHARQGISDRNKAIAMAHLQYGYFQQEIAGQTGPHYSTVSRIVQRERGRSNSKT